VESFGRTVTIVPSQNLVKQTLEDYENLGLDVGVYYGGKKDLDKTHTIYTWQSMSSVIRQRRAEKLDYGLEELLQGVVAVVVDEAHGAAANDLKAILSGPGRNIPLRWGLTGTEPKDEISKISLRVNLGPVVNRVKASELQEKGYLSSCNINIMQMVEDVAYSNYQSELSYLTTNEKRLDYLAELITSVSETGNTLFLVDRVKTGEGLLERLGEKNAVFINGGMKADDRKDHYDEVREINDKIIIATYGVAAVGINIPRLHNVMLLEPGKSFVRVIQSIGRGLRKGKDKDHVEIWDITSTAKFSKRHLTARKKYYNEAGYPFKVNKIKYRD
jgi:superfamily II DNA or RNA helicase